jgi:hypothetical protein
MKTASASMAIISTMQQPMTTTHVQKTGSVWVPAQRKERPTRKIQQIGHTGSRKTNPFCYFHLHKENKCL